MSKSVEEYHKEFDALYGGHEPNLSLSKVELAASEAAYGWQSDKEGRLTLEMFPEVFKRGFLNGYELAEKDLGWHSVEESLPPVDEEVIVLTDDLDTAPIYKIAFGHIVDRMHCSDYNGWNIPGVKYWMPMPKLPEEK